MSSPNPLGWEELDPVEYESTRGDLVRTPPALPCGLDRLQIHEDVLLSHTCIFHFIESLFYFLESFGTSGVF